MNIKDMIEAGEIELSNGLKVKFRRIPPGLYSTWQRSNQDAPKPPEREAKVVGGGTEMVPDSDNPEYRLALAKFNNETGDAWLEMICRYLDPEMPDDEDWIPDMEAMRIEVPASKRLRKVLYTKCVVLASNDDMMIASAVLAAASIVREEGVDEALDGFLRDLGGAADNEGGAEEGDVAGGEQREPAATSADSDDPDDGSDTSPNRKPSARIRAPRSRKTRRR